tara:strand:- start:323 stop:697 length:375 start_codon:yes stop_codon:yes gene_type:complete
MEGLSQFAPAILLIVTAFLIYFVFFNKSDNAKSDSVKKYQEKQNIKDVKIKVSSGIAESIDPKDYQKVIIEQNEAIIGLLGLQVVNSSGIMGDAFALIHQDKYYKNIGKYIKKDKKDSEPKRKN